MYCDVNRLQQAWILNNNIVLANMRACIPQIMQNITMLRENVFHVFAILPLNGQFTVHCLKLGENTSLELTFRGDSYYSEFELF